MKTRIALLISGRATCYEECLLKVLQNSVDYDIDLFMSINNKNKECDYFKIMEEKLYPFLKYLYIEEFNVPDDFINTSTHPQCVKQLINGKYVPLNVLSMWYNYQNAFNNAIKYEEINKIKYDFFMTFRSDIIIEKIPLFKLFDNSTLCSIDQPCQFISFGIHKTNIVSPEWVYATKEIMKEYLHTYDFIIDQSNLDNNYICHYESNVTDNCIEKNINIYRIQNIYYDVHHNRRIFDNWNNLKDTRIYNISSNYNYIDINTITK